MTEIRCNCGKEFKDTQKSTAEEKYKQHFENCLKRIKGYGKFRRKHLKFPNIYDNNKKMRY